MKLRRRRKDRNQSLLPFDVMMDIFSRLSLKTIAICRCVSKPWSSVLVHDDFRNLLLKKSQARPRSLLFAYMEDKKVFFISSPPSNHHISFSFDHAVKEISTSVSGLVCVRIRGNRFEQGRKFMVEELVICNPSTGQSLTLPRMKTKKRTGMVRLFGYDPAEKVHKVLGIFRDTSREHQVLTLGLGGTWRIMTERGVRYSNSRHRKSICINGVFYYIDEGRRDQMIICFDVRTDKYSFVKFSETTTEFLKLLECNGKLALLNSHSICVTSKSIEMWVLQDRERHEWSKLVYALPCMWKDVVDPGKRLEIVGVVTGTNEFVVSPTFSYPRPFHVYYCNFEKETVTRVLIQGMGAFGSGRGYNVHTFLNHVEDVKLMEL